VDNIILHLYLLYTFYVKVPTIWIQRKNLALVFLVFAKIVIVSLNKIGIKKNFRTGYLECCS